MEVKLKVYTQKPIIRQPIYQSTRTHIGRTVIADCSAKGYPKPRVRWVLPNGRSLTPGYQSNKYSLKYIHYKAIITSFTNIIKLKKGIV